MRTPGAAQGHAFPPAWGALVAADGNTDAYVVDNKIDPGGTTGWHKQPGPSLILVVSGQGNQSRFRWAPVWRYRNRTAAAASRAEDLTAPFMPHWLRTGVIGPRRAPTSQAFERLVT